MQQMIFEDRTLCESIQRIGLVQKLDDVSWQRSDALVEPHYSSEDMIEQHGEAHTCYELSTMNAVCWNWVKSMTICPFG